MRFINPDDISDIIPDGFEDDAQDARDEIANLEDSERSEAINNNSAIWRDLKDIFADVRNRKCWYCESIQDRSDNAMDHYRPKNNVAECPDPGGYWWLAFRWSNYRYSCTFCNSRRIDQDGGTDGGKHDHFPVWDESSRCRNELDNLDNEQVLLLDPCRRNDPDHLWFNEDGSPSPNPRLCSAEDGYAHKRAMTSIHLYHLNHVDIVERRANLCRRLREDASEGDDMLKKVQEGDMTAQQSFVSSVKRLNISIKDDQELSATALCMLEGLRESSPTAYAALRN